MVCYIFWTKLSVLSNSKYFYEALFEKHSWIKKWNNPIVYISKRDISSNQPFSLYLIKFWLNLNKIMYYRYIDVIIILYPENKISKTSL